MLFQLYLVFPPGSSGQKIVFCALTTTRWDRLGRETTGPSSSSKWYMNLGKVYGILFLQEFSEREDRWRYNYCSNFIQENLKPSFPV